jgi:hypothetical protein
MAYAEMLNFDEPDYVGGSMLHFRLTPWSPTHVFFPNRCPRTWGWIRNSI